MMIGVNPPKEETMNRSARVVIYGDSVSLAGLAIALNRQPGIEVVTLLPHQPDEETQLHSLDPKVIVFDQQQGNALNLLSCLGQNSHLTLIGMNADTDQISIWSGQRRQVGSLRDLTAAIVASLSTTIEHC